MAKSSATSYDYDCNGNLTSGAGRSYTWDHENRPTQIISGTVTENYTYDGDGERISRASGGVTTIYLGGLWEETTAGVVTSYYQFNGATIAREVFDLVEAFNDEREQQIKRWGVRPHKISFFTAYDFRTGKLEGFTVGAGWRWRSANIIGSNSKGEEITGKELSAAHMMIGYNLKLRRLPGRLRFQLNIANLFDQSDIVPSRIGFSATAPDGYVLPGGRGIAYTRYDLVQPREFRFTTTYSF